MTVHINKQDIDENIINRARNDLIFTSQGTAIAIVFGVVISLVYLNSSYVPLTALIIWSAICLFSYMLRFAVCIRYRLADDASKSDTYWQILFSVCCGLSGAIWGAAVFTIFPEESKNHQMSMIILLIILSAGTTVTHSAFRWASLSFSSFCLLPTAFFLFFQNEDGLAQLGVYIIFFLFIMISSTVYLSRTANNIFTLSYENNKLIASLKESNGDLTEKNSLLETAKKELRQANDSLQKMATTDALTNLTNRRKFEALFKVKWQRCSEERAPISLIFINIDMFKQYNDFYGQRKGDSCLVIIADYLSQAPEINRKSDCVARYSGDEFAILLCDADASYAKNTAEKLCRGIELLRISRAEIPNELSPWVSVSIGVSTEKDYDISSSEELIERADKSLYKAKRAGRNQTHCSDDVLAS